MASKIRAKAGAAFPIVSPALFDILRALYWVAEAITLPDLPETFLITSGSEGQAGDGVHAATSRHYRGEAIDLRVHNFSDQPILLKFIAVLRGRLGPAFTVLHEHPGTPHAHLHIQPVKGTVYV